MAQIIETGPASTASAPSTTSVIVVSTPNSFSAEASSTKARARRISAPGNREETWRRCRRRERSRRGARRHVQLQVAEEDVADGGRDDQRHGLHQVGADQLAGPQRRVEHHQRDDHQRAAADRGHADDDAPDDPDDDGGRAGRDVRGPALRVSAAARRRACARSAQPQVGADDSPDAARRSATPEGLLTAESDVAPSPRPARSGPRERRGTEPMQSHFTRSSGPCPRRWTKPPTGFMTAADTSRSTPRPAG